MDLDINSPATWIVLGALVVVALIWHLASGPLREKTGAAGGWVVLFGWIVLILLGATALFSVTDCRCRAGAQESAAP